MQSPEQLTKKGQALTAAHNRVINLIAHYTPLLYNVAGWPYSWDFNNLHDLQYRIESRINEHNGEVYDYNWNKNGWVAITA